MDLSAVIIEEAMVRMKKKTEAAQRYVSGLFRRIELELELNLKEMREK